jgi:hypothetical protein
MEFVMSDHIQKHNPLLAALALAFVATTSGPVNAMSFFDAEEYEEQVSAKMEMEKKEEVVVPAAPQPEPAALADRLNKIVDTLENPEGVKHYSFTAVRGQKVMIREIRHLPEKSPWKIGIGTF